MKAVELEQWLSTFNNLVKDAAIQLKKTQDDEQAFEDMTQDLLHTCELDPDRLSDVDLIALLHDLRWQRRDAKMELEISRVFSDYVAANSAAWNKLPDVIGKMRKILNRQPLDVYRYKTEILGAKDTFLSRKDPTPEYIQLTLIGWEDEKGKEKKK